MIYLDNAATTLQKPQSVIDAVVMALTTMGNCGRGAYFQAMAASEVIFETRQELADLFHVAGPEQIAFSKNATEALNTAIFGLIDPEDHVVTTDLEHNSVLRPLYQLEKKGASISFAKADQRGCIDYDEMERLLLPSTKAIICTHASNLTGNLLDLERIGQMAKKQGVLFFVDASQTAGVFELDMQKMNIDVLCFTGHKSLYGPQGTGGLAVKPNLSIRPLTVGGSGVFSFEKTHPSVMPTALEAGTQNGPGIAGLGAGVRFVKETGIEKIRAYEQELVRIFYKKVSQLEAVCVYGDFSDIDNPNWQHAPVVSLNIKNVDSARIAYELEDRFQIAVRCGAHCAPRMHEALGTKHQGAVRFSFSYFNTKKEVQIAADAVRQLAEEFA